MSSLNRKKPSSKQRSTPSSAAKTGTTSAAARRAIKAMPDVRAGKVTGLKVAVDNGDYEVPPQEIARKMVDESLRESARLKRKSRPR